MLIMNKLVRCENKYDEIYDLEKKLLFKEVLYHCYKVLIYFINFKLTSLLYYTEGYKLNVSFS